MASRKMTFTIAEDVASQFLRRVAARNRSRYVTEAIAAKLREREEKLIQACEVANNNDDVLAIERDWDAMTDKTDGVEEPWNLAPAR
jgi:ubiquinone biosynthesis protein UbiJ